MVGVEWFFAEQFGGTSFLVASAHPTDQFARGDVDAPVLEAAKIIASDEPYSQKSSCVITITDYSS